MVKLFFTLVIAVFPLSSITVLPNVCHSFSIFMVLLLNIFIACDQAAWGFSSPCYVNVAPLLSPCMQTSTTDFLLCSGISCAALILCKLQHFCNDNNNNANAFHPVGVPGWNNLHPLKNKKYGDEFRVRLWFHDTA